MRLDRLTASMTFEQRNKLLGKKSVHDSIEARCLSYVLRNFENLSSESRDRFTGVICELDDCFKEVGWDFCSFAQHVKDYGQVDLAEYFMDRGLGERVARLLFKIFDVCKEIAQKEIEASPPYINNQEIKT